MALFDNSGPRFDRDTPVIRFQFGKDPNARWVLWPVFAWRVVAPVPKARSLNVFQHAVLNLARAQITAINAIAARLLIAPDLAALIVLELQNMALLDYAGAPTQRGLDRLDDIEEDPPDEAQVGHVLSDVFNGKLWPRFLTGDLPIADVELNEEGWPVLLSGSAGDPWKDRTYAVLPTRRDTIVASRPEPRDVLRAAQRHRRQRNFHEVDDERDVPRLQRVSFVDNDPQAFLLALRARRHDSGDWMVDDPLGHGESIELRARVEGQFDNHPGLRGRIEGLVGADQSSPKLNELQVEAEWKVEERLTLAIRKHDDLRERLVAMQRALLEAQMYDAPADKWNDVLVKGQRAVERLLDAVDQPCNRANTLRCEKLSWKDSDLNHQLLNGIAADMGFDVPLPRRLSSVRRGKVQSAETYNTGGLRSLLILGLLAAHHDDEHVFRQAGRREPDLLHRLDDLAAARDHAAHDNKDTSPDKVPHHVDTVYAAVNAFLLNH
ncbi:hypothetical protein DV096_18440 [Bradymonadaceae bacterium TMQ3]|nr:hypothetical protein DV096_18440 [Bradymonadaceae bacterium TMQ3]TXC74488.1 hypothetical protein FRC91_15340 [Bradymonadales bacterium TMQ1]